MPVCDSTLGEVVRGEFQGNPVAVHDLDTITPESSSHGRQHCLADVQLDRKHSSFELFNDLAHYFNRIFFWQMSTFPILILPITSGFGHRRHRHDDCHRRRRALPSDALH